MRFHPRPNDYLSGIEGQEVGKAPWVDTLHADILEADITTTKLLFDRFSKTRDHDVIPQDCSKCLWRGITRIYITSKIFYIWCILLKRINTAIDVKPRQCRKWIGIYQIFTLRNIIKQRPGWTAPLYLNFIDIKKSFVSGQCIRNTSILVNSLNVFNITASYRWHCRTLHRLLYTIRYCHRLESVSNNIWSTSRNPVDPLLIYWGSLRWWWPGCYIFKVHTSPR